MADQQDHHDQRGDDRAPDAGEPETNAPMREKSDPYASPLGRGANPGSVDPTGGLGSGHSISGQRGMGSPGERGGPSGFVSRENEDSQHEAREAPQGTDSSANDSRA